MDTVALETFITVARLQSFSEAAEKLHITQPAISKRIQLLEQELGVTLFDRINRRIQLTDSGRKLIEQGQEILLQLDNLKATMQTGTGNIAGKLSLAVSHHVGLHRLPPYLKQFSVTHPDVELDLRFTDSEIACQQVEEGAVELALITLPNSPSKRLTCTSLWHDPLEFVISAENPAKKKMGMKQLAAIPAILPTSKTYTGRLILSAFEQQGLTPNIAMSTNYLETIKMMVSIGLAWSVLPASMVDDSIVCIQNNIKLERNLGYARHRQRTLSHAAQAFIKTVETQ